jgi:hypothetical protein
VHRNETFWWTHPELWVSPGGEDRGSRYFDYAKKGVRDHAMALVREILERWDVDGLELDWMREIYCLGRERAKRDSHYLTSFMRDVATEVAAASRRRGHPILLAVRLSSSLANAVEFGFDVRTLAKEGIVDVVITENSLEPMITFRNGDRYYSCFQNSTFQNGKVYSSHKYIDGFYIVKNFAQENYSFTVTYDNFNSDYVNVTAKSLVCSSFDTNIDHAADGRLSIVSKTYISDQVVEMTIADLEAFFNSIKGPGNDDTGELEINFDTYKNGEFAFVLYRDNTFIYYNLQTGAVERRGNYTRRPTEIQFTFTDGNTVTETVSGLLTVLDSFLYEGSIYEVDPY